MDMKKIFLLFIFLMPLLLACTMEFNDPPEPEIYNPSNGATITGSVDIRARAEDDSDTMFYYYLEIKNSTSVRLAGWTTQPYTELLHPWDTTVADTEDVDNDGDTTEPLYPNDTYTITVKAMDYERDTGTTSITVTVNN
jgi:hypothetical protein